MSVLSQVLIVVLGFVSRSVFIAHLGVGLLGVNSVLTSALAILTLADLGINGAVMYALYGPLKDNDTERVAAIVLYAQRLFRGVALAVASVGLAGIPFIHGFVRLDEPVPWLEAYYLVLLANTAVGYLMLNRIVLLDADQKVYITKTYSMVFNTVRSVAQIASILLLGSFIVYLVIQVASTVANNLFVYLRVGKMYPYLKDGHGAIVAGERRSILESVRALMIFRLGGLALQNSAPLLISVIVGTLALGYYSNYMLLAGSAVMITETAFAALTPSVGNLIAGGNTAAGRRLFHELVLLSTVLHGVIAVFLVALIDDFVGLWLGSTYVLPLAVGAGVAINFYVTGTMMPMWSFRSATGLFRRTQWVIVVTAILSVGLSFALGHAYGLAGVVIAPALARVLTGSWYEPWLLLRDHLSGSVVRYFTIQAAASALWAAAAAGALAVGDALNMSPLPAMAAKIGFLLVVLPAAVWLVFARTEEFGRLGQRLRGVVVRTPSPRREGK